MNGQSKDFSVVIVGGGMCGLAAAYALSQASIPVRVFESASRFEEVGAGVGFGPNAIRALEGLGVLPAVLQRAEEKEPRQRLFKFITGTGSHETVFDYETSNSENMGLGIYRPTFLDAVVQLLDPSITQFHKRCTKISQTASGGSLIHFADGTTHEADLVIGADGIRSATRGYVVGEDVRSLVFTNTYAYRGLISVEDLVRAGVKTDLTKRPVCFVGYQKHIICFPIKNNTVVNFVVFVANHDIPMGPELPMPWVQSVPHEELKATWEDWGPDAQAIVDLLKKPSRWSVHACIPPLKSFVRDRVVLVGDAAHAMLPHLGAGVGQGFEDVYLLTKLLAHPQTNRTNIDGVLAEYNQARPPRANSVLERSTRAGEIYDNYLPGKGYDISTVAEHLRGQWEPVWNYDIRKEAEIAVERLHESSVFQS